MRAAIPSGDRRRRRRDRRPGAGFADAVVAVRAAGARALGSSAFGPHVDDERRWPARRRRRRRLGARPTIPAVLPATTAGAVALPTRILQRRPIRLPASNPPRHLPGRTPDDRQGSPCCRASRRRPTGSRHHHLRRLRPAPHGREPVEWARLHDDARAMAAALQARGVGPGDHVAVLGPTTRAARHRDPGHLARRRRPSSCCRCRCGSARSRSSSTRPAAASSTPTPRVVRRRPRPRAVPRPAEPGDPPVVLLDELARRRAPRRGGTRPPDDPDALAILQFTSGSTADPKGVMLPRPLRHREHRRHRRAARDRPDDDRGVSWLPAVPRHGAHRAADDADAHRLRARARRAAGLPRRAGELAASGSRSSAARSPRARTSRTRSRRARCGAPSGLDLSAWRLALNGAEPIDPARSRRSAPPARRTGSTPKSPFCVFGMAEATLAVTFPDAGRGHGASTPSTATRSSTSGTPRPSPADADGAAGSRCSAARCAGFELRVVRPRDRAGARRPRGRRARAARPVGDARLLPQPRRHRGRVPRRVVPHRRPRVPGRRRARGVRPPQGHDHRRRPQRVPRRHRARRRGRRRRARRQRDRVRQRRPPGPRGDRRRRRDQGRRRSAPVRDAVGDQRVATPSGVPPVDVVLVRAGHAAEDVVGQAAALAVPRPLPRRRSSSPSDAESDGSGTGGCRA